MSNLLENSNRLFRADSVAKLVESIFYEIDAPLPKIKQWVRIHKLIGDWIVKDEEYNSRNPTPESQSQDNICGFEVIVTNKSNEITIKIKK